MITANMIYDAESRTYDKKLSDYLRYSMPMQPVHGQPIFYKDSYSCISTYMNGSYIPSRFDFYYILSRFDF